MLETKSILLIGSCGVGKTWVMNQLKTHFNLTKHLKLGKFVFLQEGDLSIVGKYDGGTFEGSDKLSMAVVADLDQYNAYTQANGILSIFEGDRFTNSTFIGKNKPHIIKIDGTGEKGREQRGSKQTERHLKAVATRVSNIKEDKLVKSSTEAFEYICQIIENQ